MSSATQSIDNEVIHLLTLLENTTFDNDLKEQLTNEIEKLLELPKAKAKAKATEIVFDDYKEGKFECSICLDSHEVYETVFLGNCNHTFCGACMFGYCKTKIIEADLDIKCPDKKCQKKLDYREIKNLISLDKELDEKYEDFLYLKELESLDDIVWCPIEHCSKPVPFDIYDLRIRCIHCNYIFCSKCKEEYHPEFNDCNLAKKYKGKINDFETWLKVQGELGLPTKSCSKCGFLTQKISGCDTVVCGKCKFKFCWLCTLENKSGHFNTPNGYGCINTYKEIEAQRKAETEAKAEEKR